MLSGRFLLTLASGFSGNGVVGTTNRWSWLEFAGGERRIHAEWRLHGPWECDGAVGETVIGERQQFA